MKLLEIIELSLVNENKKLLNTLKDKDKKLKEVYKQLENYKIA